MTPKERAAEIVEEIAKSVCTARMFDGELGEIIKSSGASTEELRRHVDHMWDGSNDTAERQRAMYRRDAKIAFDIVASALRVPENHVRDENGVDMRVCGDPKLTHDGAIAFEEGTCWCVYFHVGNDKWQVSECRRSGNPFDYGCWWQVDDCDSETVEIYRVYSTKELAEAALAAKEKP